MRMFACPKITHMILTYVLREIPPVGKKTGRRPVGKGKLLAFNRLNSVTKGQIMAFHQFKPDGELFTEYQQRTIFGSLETVTVIEGHLANGREAVFTFTLSEAYDD